MGDTTGGCRLNTVTSRHTNRNALLMRSRRTEMLADQIRALRETDGVVTYLPLQPRPR